MKSFPIWEIQQRRSRIRKLNSTDKRDVEIFLEYNGSHPLKELTFYHNGAAIDVPLSGNPEEILIPLKLTHSENNIAARAVDQKGVKSAWLRLKFQYIQGRKGILRSLAEEEISFRDIKYGRPTRLFSRWHFSCHRRKKLARMPLHDLRGQRHCDSDSGLKFNKKK